MAEQVANKSGGVPARPKTKKTNATRRIEVVMRKGGAGKTTTTNNVAEALGQMGYRVLVVDLDANASLTKVAGVKLGELKHSIYDVLMVPADLLATREVIHEPPHLHFELLPGSENLGYAEPSLLMARKQHALKDRLDEVDKDYDFVFLDTAGHESFMHSLGHVYASEVLLPTEADISNWETLETTLASVRKVREDGLNPNLTIRSILVTRYQPRTRFGEELLKRLGTEYGELLFPFVVMQTIRAKEAQAYGMPIVAYDPESQAAHAYKKLAEYLARG
jgi:chromosome partitioning protein